MELSTGLLDLDKLLTGLFYGDSLAWRVDSIEDYKFYVELLSKDLLSKGSELVYFRFADHEPLLLPQKGITIVEIDALKGFEHFIVNVRETISKIELRGNFIFDSMSELPNSCYSDRMVGNFFKLICPYLCELNGFAYFSFMRYKHSFHAEQHISENTQILLDVYSDKNVRYIKPFQVNGRYTRSMFRLHEQKEKTLAPVKESLKITEVLSSVPWPGLRSASYRMIGAWDRMFIHAEEVLEGAEKNEIPQSKADEIFLWLIQIVISRDKKVLSIAKEYFTLKDLIYLWKRMIGTGFIGGKSVGMLLVHAVLRKESPELYGKLEQHDSFFIGSDAFYTFLVENDLWWEKQKQKDPETYLDHIEKARKKIMTGIFPKYILQRFADMLDYYGQAPIIVRSSSLLEDAFGNAFAGKYESVFCPNQGTHKERLENLTQAIKTVYASTMSKGALSYRKSRGVLGKDEQMALLIQRVSGTPRGPYYYPQLSGVGFSFNPYAWSRDIDPKSGMIRLVYGLGTRAVDRSDNDYTRVVALNAPERRPESNDDEVIRYSQKKVDLLDLEDNSFLNTDFDSIVDLETHLDLFGTRDLRAERYYREKGIFGKTHWTLTFEKLLKKTDFVESMRSILEIVKNTYKSNVDLEFTCNFYEPEAYKICLVQCRPFQVDEHDILDVRIPEINEKNLLLKAQGAVVGRSGPVEVESIIFVDPLTYGQLSESDRYSVARTIGKIMRKEIRSRRTILLGPGRWGTSTPSLGVPVSFADIRSAYAICEIDTMHEGLVPDLSLGTHFFNEMVETGMVYLGYFNNKEGNVLNLELLRKAPNTLSEIRPQSSELSNIIHVINCPIDGKQVHMVADPVDQVGMVYFDSDRS
jgi:pyruvate,water dikinase